MYIYIYIIYINKYIYIYLVIRGAGVAAEMSACWGCRRDVRGACLFSSPLPPLPAGSCLQPGVESGKPSTVEWFRV